MFRRQVLQRVLFSFVSFTRFVRVVRPLDPFVRAACLCRTVFFVSAVRVSGLSLPSVRAMRRPSELSGRTIIISAAPPNKLNYRAVVRCVPRPPSTMLAHSKQKQTRKQKWKLATLDSGGREGRAQGKGRRRRAIVATEKR